MERLKRSPDQDPPASEKYNFSAFERKVSGVHMHTTGLFPSQFDPTIDAVLATVQALGTTPTELEADQEFLLDVMNLIAVTDPSVMPLESTIEFLDVAYIGLVYHRHMPFLDDETGEMRRVTDDPMEYIATLSALSIGLIREQGLPPEALVDLTSEAAAFTLPHLRRPGTLDMDGTKLHRDMLAMVLIGLIVHRFLPTTDHHPRKDTPHANE